MEVFVHDLPDQVNFGLANQLRPKMRALGIGDHAYDCEKPFKKRFGSITFLHASDAQKFLDAHGQIDVPPRKPISRLKLLDCHVLCTKSKRYPNPLTLRGLAKQEKDSRIERHPSALPVAFSLQSLSCGHYTYTNNYLTFVPEVHWQAVGTATFGKQNLVIKLDVGERTQVRIPLSSIVELVWATRGCLTLTLSAVPQFLCNADLGQLMAGLMSGERQIPKQMRLTSLGPAHDEVVGVCLIYHLQLDYDNFARNIEKLKLKKTLNISWFDIRVYRPSLSAQDGMAHEISQAHRSLTNLLAEQALPFEVIYQLQALIHGAYLHPSTVVKLAMEIKGAYKADRAVGRRPISVAAIRKLFRGIDWPHPHGEASLFEASSLMEYISACEKDYRQGVMMEDALPASNPNLTRIHRVMVTPSGRTTLHGPELENKNRVLRKFPNHNNYFIRVQFCEEDGQDLQFNHKIAYDRIFDRFKAIMIKGLQIAGRTYRFLGWSHSSLRAYSIWFVAPFLDDNNGMQWDVSIIGALGDFGKIYCPAKCAARIGQAFSETPFPIPLDENKIFVRQIPDVISVDQTRVFSDGVGTLSTRVMLAIWDSLPQNKSSPTSFQIRYAGAKGMLALDSRLKGSQICIRPSMTKFESPEKHHLEICDMASKPIPLYLNRQMIKILEDMGVPDDWFSGLQNKALDDLRGITTCAQRTAKFLERKSIGESIKLHSLIRTAYRHGFDYRQYGFLRQVVEAVVLRELRLLKHKARIAVTSGITLFGILDEYEFLEEGEVFVTFDLSGVHSGPRNRPPPSGPLLVTRSPALHPGDIQRVRNSTPPQGHPLADIANCIVFSSKGKRDLPSQLSGGDLDGDLYNVLWDEEVVSSNIKTFNPAEYPRTVAVNIGRPVEVKDIAEFFTDFMKTDLLGVIATRHMILADQKDKGSLDVGCMELARLHSVAVDFSKTGKPANFMEMPKCNKWRPDFLAPGPSTNIHKKSEMEFEDYIVPDDDNDDDIDRPRYQYYESNKVLGRLYRAVDEKKIWDEDIHTAVHHSGGVTFWDWFRRFVLEETKPFGRINWKERREEAQLLRSAYEDAIYSAMRDFSEHPLNPISELEVFIGHLLNKTGVSTRRQHDRSHKLLDEFERIASWITIQMTGNKDVSRSGYVNELDGLERTLACVNICVSDEMGKGGTLPHARKTGNKADPFPRLQSFPLVAACAVLREIRYLKDDGSLRDGTVSGLKTAPLPN